jgi:hypothetical protein
VDANWRALGGGEGGEIDLMGEVGDEGCDNGGEMGLRPAALVDIGAGTEEVGFLSESTGFSAGLVFSEAGGEIVPSPSPMTFFFSKFRIPVLPPGDGDADPSVLVLSLFNGLIMPCTVFKMDAIAGCE